MTVKAPLRVRQSTITTGTGTYSLIAATGNFQNFNAPYATGAVVPYCATDNSGNYEIGVGILTTGGPDTISRTAILISSNSNSAVSWASGTKDIFAFELTGSEYPISFSLTKTADVSDGGNVYLFTGSSAGTFTLPALSVLPLGWGINLINIGSALCTVAPNGADGWLFGIAPVLRPGSVCPLVPTATGWAVDDPSTSPNMAYVTQYAGNPNTHVAGYAAGGITTGSAPDFCIDTTNGILYYCTTTGSTSTAVWTTLADSLGYSYQAPSTGFSITIANRRTLLNPAGTLATGTITTPTSPVDKQLFTVTSTQQVTAVTWVGGSGATVLCAPAFLSPGVPVTFQYVLSVTSWLPT